MVYKPSKSILLKLWLQFGGNAIGRWLISRLVCFKAPYFATIKPILRAVQPGRVEVFINKRRRVHNHIKTVHAIAMCNAAELAAGLCMDISLDSDFRWIPVGMEVKYQKLAKTDLTAICDVDYFHWSSPQDVEMPVSVTDTSGKEVFSAKITMRISKR